MSHRRCGAGNQATEKHGKNTEKAKTAVRAKEHPAEVGCLPQGFPAPFRVFSVFFRGLFLNVVA
jgi:hypothetical protein